MYKEVSIKSPAKFFIAGEYAITRPFSKALVLAVETNFTISIKESHGKSRLTTNVGMEDYVFDFHDFQVDSGSPWNFTLQVLKNILENHKIAHDLQVEIIISSDLGYGENKKGYGSSASLVSGIVRAMNIFFDWKDERLFEYAAKAHRQIQGSGSMGDVASTLMGGTIEYMSPDNEMKGWQIQVINFLKKFNLSVYAIETEKSVKTGEKLQDLNLSDDFYIQSNATVAKLVEELSAEKLNFSMFKKLLNKNQQLLIHHLPTGYLIKEHQYALSLIDSNPDWAGKISGAGFGENIIFFSQNNEQLSQLKEKLISQNMKLIELKVAKVIHDRK